MGSLWRKLIRHIHPEGIPWPGSLLYNAISSTAVFNRHYDLVADDVSRFGSAECILDIGTGPARLLLALCRTFPDASLLGIDISPAMVKKARENIEAHGKIGRIEVKVASADNLPFGDETFDLVISTGSLHHWKNPHACLTEAHRILREGGYALLYDLVRQMPKSISREIKAQFGWFRFALFWLHSFEEPFLNADEMGTLGEQSVFVIEGTHFVGGLCCLILRKEPTPLVA